MEFSIGESTYVVPTTHQDHNILNPIYWAADVIETYYRYGVDDDFLELAGRLLTEEEPKYDSGGRRINCKGCF